MAAVVFVFGAIAVVLLLLAAREDRWQEGYRNGSGSDAGWDGGGDGGD